MAREEKLIAEAVDDCQALLSSPLLDAVADRAASYVSDQVWTSVTKDWSGRNCAGLATFARRILDGKTWLHTKLGQLMGLLLASLGLPLIVGRFADQVCRRLPLPWDHKLIVVARGMQVTGIVICFLNDRDLAECHCLVDLVKAEGKDRLHELLADAAKDWANLHVLGSSAPRRADEPPVVDGRTVA